MSPGGLSHDWSKEISRKLLIDFPQRKHSSLLKGMWNCTVLSFWIDEESAVLSLPYFRLNSLETVNCLLRYARSSLSWFFAFGGPEGNQ